MDNCSCLEVYLGMKPTGIKNWSPTCLEHGIDSEWFNSDEQSAIRAEKSERLRDLQLQARAARKDIKKSDDNYEL